MERGPIIVIVVVVAALGLFALQLLSRGPHFATEPGTEQLARGQGPTAGTIDAGSSGTIGGASEGVARGPVDGRAGPRSYLGQRGAATAARQRSAQTILGGGSGRRGGTAGTSSAARSGSSVRVGMAGGLDSERSATGGLRTGERSRSELIETLASQPASPGGLLEPEDVADPEQEVVLSVASPEDTEKAEQATDVDAPPSGEEGIVLTPDSVLAFPDAGNVRGDAGTISLDIQPNWAGGDESNNSLAQILNPNQWANTFQLVKNGRYLRFILRDNTGAERDISVPIEAWVPGEQHNVTVTWGDAATTMYIDGRVVGQNTYPGQFEIRPGTPMHLGSAYANYKGFDGVIGKATVFGHAQSADEVATRY